MGTTDIMDNGNVYNINYTATQKYRSHIKNNKKHDKQ